MVDGDIVGNRKRGAIQEERHRAPAPSRRDEKVVAERSAHRSHLNARHSAKDVSELTRLHALDLFARKKGSGAM